MSEPMPMPLDVRLMNLMAAALLLLFAGLALSALAMWVARHPVFAIRGITVGGDVTHSNAVTLRANVASRLTGTFLTADLSAMRQAFETVPWVRRAVVRRDFPNRLKVVLEEHRAVAYWGAEGESSLLNSYGEVFEANAGEIEQEGLPRLSGPRAQSAQVLAVYRELRPVFGAVDMELEWLDLSGRGSWRAQFDNGAVVELGRGAPDELVARARHFAATLGQVAARYGRGVNALEAADLRHENGYALRLRGVSTVQPLAQKK